MLRSRQPVSFLLSLLGALLMLCPELLLGMPGMPYEVPATDAWVQRALAFAVEQYNKDRGDGTNYFKVLRLVKVLFQVEAWETHHIMVELVKTTCKKKPGWKIVYKNIQTCNRLPMNPEKPICYFRVGRIEWMIKQKLEVTLCT